MSLTKTPSTSIAINAAVGVNDPPFRKGPRGGATNDTWDDRIWERSTSPSELTKHLEMCDKMWVRTRVPTPGSKSQIPRPWKGRRRCRWRAHDLAHVTQSAAPGVFAPFWGRMGLRPGPGVGSPCYTPLRPPGLHVPRVGVLAPTRRPPKKPSDYVNYMANMRIPNN